MVTNWQSLQRGRAEFGIVWARLVFLRNERLIERCDACQRTHRCPAHPPVTGILGCPSAKPLRQDRRVPAECSLVSSRVFRCLRETTRKHRHSLCSGGCQITTAHRVQWSECSCLRPRQVLQCKCTSWSSILRVVRCMLRTLHRVRRLQSLHDGGPLRQLGSCPCPAKQLSLTGPCDCTVPCG
jgi:hypothetical protein